MGEWRKVDAIQILKYVVSYNLVKAQPLKKRDHYPFEWVNINVIMQGEYTSTKTWLVPASPSWDAMFQGWRRSFARTLVGFDSLAFHKEMIVG